MKSRCQVILCFLGVAIFGLSVAAHADVTGSLSVHFVGKPQTPPNSGAPLHIHIMSEVNLTYIASGLSTTLHTHFGTKGVEDVFLVASATLGALDLSAKLIFASFPSTTCGCWDMKLGFLRKEVTAAVLLSGLKFSNLAIFTDANAQGELEGISIPNFEGGAPLGAQSSIFAFGDVLSVSGQTPSGIEITFQAGLCLQKTPYSIVKHTPLSQFTINPDCVTAPKPDILFDFESISITAIPLSTGVMASATVLCMANQACSLTSSFSFNDPTVAIPFTATIQVIDLTTFDFGGADVHFNTTIGTFVVGFGPTGLIEMLTINTSFALDQYINRPYDLIANFNFTPGISLISGFLQLLIDKPGYTASATASFGGGPPAVYQGLSFAIDVPGNIVSFAGSATINVPSGLEHADFKVTVVF